MQPDRASLPRQSDAEIYEDGWGIYWVPSAGRTKEQATEIIRRVSGCKPFSAELVRGHTGENERGPYFEPDALSGAVEMWEVEAA